MERVLDRIRQGHLNPVRNAVSGVRLSQPTYAKIQKMAMSYGWSVSAVMRAMLEIAIEEIERNPEVKA